MVKGVIYPIPKPGDWNLNLDKTRPITLLECPRKHLLKILTNRLTKIFTEHWNILEDNNFAALPGKSTNEPLHILNNVMEEARENKKELWILLQDMSKAYDLVHREHLWKAMQRLKIPNHFINIIKNSLLNRTNRVITDLGLTDEYKMKNGIDQGETMSPILWVIYYDPVFSMIKKHKGIGYKMKHEWKQNTHTKEKSKLEIEIHNIAFMDDTTWIGRGKKELEEQLSIADKFNRFNGIKVNPNKSKLIVINNKETSENTHIKYGLNESLIYPEKKDEPTRFLGVWIGANNNKNYVKKQVKRDVEIIHSLAKGKTITAEQMTYVINAVAIPRIEYKMNITIFNKKEADESTTKLRKLLRYKIGITNTSPNVLLSNKEIFNLINLYNRQKEKQITELELRLNDKHDLGITMEIRNRQLQTKEHLHDSPLEIWNYNNINMFKGSILAQILCLMNKQGLSIIYKGIKENYFEVEGGSYPLIAILKNGFRKERKSLQSKGLLYLEQIIYKNAMIMREWKNI